MNANGHGHARTQNVAQFLSDSHGVSEVQPQTPVLGIPRGAQKSTVSEHLDDLEWKSEM